MKLLDDAARQLKGTLYLMLSSALEGLTARAAVEVDESPQAPGRSPPVDPNASPSRNELRRRVRAAVVEAESLKGTAAVGARPEAVFGLPPQRVPKPLVASIGPEQARKLLSFNSLNRDVYPAVVEEYARLMMEGRWKTVSNAISMTCDGVAGNGQHRLIAILASGVTASFLFALGMPPDSIYAEDRGKRRNLADDIGIAGLAPGFNRQQKLVLAAAGRIIYHLASGRGPWTPTPIPTEQEIAAVLADHPRVLDMTRDYYSAVKQANLAPAPACAFFGLFAEADPVKGAEFARRLVNNENLSAGTTLHTLHGLCTGSGSKKRMANRVGQMCLLIRAWNNYRSRREVNGLHSALRDGKLPHVEGLRYDLGGRLLPRG